MKTVNLEKAIIEFNSIMFDYCWEHCTIGTSFSENTEGWNLRDMVSEAQYHYDTCYESGNCNEEGRYPDYWELDSSCILSQEKYRRVIRHNESEKEMHEDWLRKTRRLRNFIRKYKNHIGELKCVNGHCSCWD